MVMASTTKITWYDNIFIEGVEQTVSPMLHVRCVANAKNRWEIFPSLLIGTSIS